MFLGKLTWLRSTLPNIFLQRIYIANNPITQVNSESLQGLQGFFIRNGELRVPPSINAVCTDLRFLFFMQNHITYISDDYFHNCDNLIGVSFACNRLKYLPNMSCISDTINQGNFSNNMIQRLGNFLDLTFPKLWGLYLQHNQIRYFIYDHNKTPRLAHLNIAHNHLFHLPHLNSLITAPMLKADYSYISVELAYNPWNCSADYEWILKLLCNDGTVVIGACFRTFRVIDYWSHKNYTSRFCDINNMLCASPLNINGSTMRNAGEIP